jgi:hypothetical protein
MDSNTTRERSAFSDQPKNKTERHPDLFLNDNAFGYNHPLSLKSADR